MRKLLIATAVAATCFAPQAFAQAKNFEGFSLGGNINLANSKTDIVALNTGFSGSESDTNLGLQGQYAFALGDKFVLGFGLSFGLGDLKAGFINGTTQSTIKDSYSIYLAPGYAISDTTLIYGKLAGLNAKAELSNAGGTFAKDTSGLGFGVGVQSFLNKNMFWQAEFTQNDYDKVEYAPSIPGLYSQKPSSSILSVGVGFKF